MRVPLLVSEFFDWRWAPCVGLTAGSLAFVAFAVLLIPAQFGAAPRSAESQMSFNRPSAPPQRALFGASLARTSIPSFAQRPSEAASPPPPAPAPVAINPAPPPQRGFSPIVERPPEPPAPPTMLDAPPPLPPAVVVQPPDLNVPPPVVQ